MFKQNEGIADRVIRVVVGLTLLGLAVSGSVGAWAYLGVVPLATGLLGSCPAYSIFGISTCGIKKSE